MGKDDIAVVEPARFRAFVSYSHADAAIAKRLHRKIETYRLPKLLRKMQPDGRVNGRVGRLFRDREDLPAALDLSESVKLALSQSQALIVLCSPNSKNSPWVAKEIDLFRQLHPNRPILAALVKGEPDDAFPEALLKAGEPLAADLRKGGDGWRLGLLKLIAGVTEVPLDALAQRDAQRNIRRVTAVTLATVFGLIVMIGMTTYAIQQRNAAQVQQAQAEELIEFMLTDLRKNLKSVGRIDVMASVNEQAMTYYENQGDLVDMPLESLERRARVLHAMGEDDQKRGELGEAYKKFQQAHRATGALLARHPNDFDRIFRHVQSTNRLVQIEYWRKDYEEAKSKSNQNKKLISRLMRAPTKSPEWLRQAGYSYGNECARLITTKSRPDEALKECSTALEYVRQLIKMVPSDKQAVSDLANRYAWLADAYFANSQTEKGFELRNEQIRLVKSLVEADPDNFSWREQWVATQMSYAELLREHQRFDEADVYAARSHAIAIQLSIHDPDNAKYAGWKKRTAKLINGKD